MKFKLNISLNLGIINFFRKLIVKIIHRLEKINYPKQEITFHDKKTILEIFKHYLNIYKSYLSKRSKLNKKNSLETLNIYSINKVMGNSLFLIDIKKFAGYEGYYYLDKDSPLIKTAMQLIANKYLKVEDSYLFDFFSHPAKKKVKIISRIMLCIKEVALSYFLN